MNVKTFLVGLLAIGLAVVPLLIRGRITHDVVIPNGRSEVVFWHFWGGEDRAVVDDVVKRFNESQDQYFVRSIAMPGNNLQAKLFLSVTGGDPPDLVNQDDPVLADWADRGVIHAIDEFVPQAEIDDVRAWMLDSAERLSVYEDRMVGICNGLDVRALYYNRTVLDRHGLQPPDTLEELDSIAFAIHPPDPFAAHGMYGFLPDARRLWAWGYVFGGDFYDPDSGEVVADSPEILAAVDWMAGYSRRYGWDNIAAYRKGDQSLPGKPFPLLPISDDSIQGRYALIMDGQWRVRNIKAFQRRRRSAGLEVPEFGVVPLPIPAGAKARRNAGWVNGNFFVVPKGAKNKLGAWEFSKFWIGYTDAGQAAKTCRDGGWIPVSKSVADHVVFQDYLDSTPMFRAFVDLAASPAQYPTPNVVGAAMFRRSIERVAYDAMSDVDRSPQGLLSDANRRIGDHLERVGSRSSGARSSREGGSDAQ